MLGFIKKPVPSSKDDSRSPCSHTGPGCHDDRRSPTDSNEDGSRSPCHSADCHDGHRVYLGFEALRFKI